MARKASAHKPPKTTLAFQDDAALRTAGPARNALLAQMRKMGAKNVRYNVIYGKTAGGTDLTELDSLIDDARRHGLRVQPTLMADPKYLNPTGGLTYANQDPKLWAQFARNVAQRERGRVQRYEVGNEPNYPAFTKGADTNARQAGRTYRSAYRAAYGALKGTDRSTGVLLGGLTPGGGDPREFMRGVLGGKPLKASGFSYHPYENQEGRWDINTLGDLQASLGRYKRQGKLQTVKGQQAPLYLTEYGVQRGTKSDAARASQVAQAYRLAQKAGARQFLQYQLTDKTLVQPAQAADGYTAGRPGGRSAPAWDTSIGTAGGDLSLLARALVKRARKPIGKR